MKNRFGFIPIVLPAIVMVLIIGLINLTGPQAAQAQEADVSKDSAQLMGLSLIHDGSDNLLMPMFESGRGRYTATVDYAVTTVTVAATVMTDSSDTVSIAATGVNPHTAATGVSADITTGNEGDTTITVTVTDGDGTATPADTATYEIVLTQKTPAVHANGPRLTALSLTSGENGTPARSLMRMNGGTVTFEAGTAGINMFKVSVPYTDRSVLLTATAGTGIDVKRSPAKSPTEENDDDGPDDGDDDYRVALPGIPSSGQDATQRITVNTEASDGSSRATYTIMVTRRAPELADAGGITLVRPDEITAVVLFGTYDSEDRDYTAKVDFNIDSTTIEADPGDVTRRELKRITMNGRLATDTVADAGVDDTMSHVAVLPAGQTTTLGVEVDHWLQNLYGSKVDNEDATARVLDPDRGSTSTGKYAVAIMRENPKLAAVNDTPEMTDDGIYLTHGPDLKAPEAAEYMLDPTYGPDDKKYKAKVPYQYDFATINATEGEAPDSDSIQIRHSGFNDHRTDINGFQVQLRPGVSKTVTVSARSENNPSARTDYMVTLTRERTPLDMLALCEDDVPSCDVASDNDDATVGARLTDDNLESGQIGLMPPGTTTPHEFNSATTTYDAVVPYKVSSATVKAENDSDSQNGRKLRIETPDGIDTTSAATRIATTSLMVGDNAISVRSEVPGNARDYGVTLMRKAPEPVIQFSLYDANNELMAAGTTTLSLMLDASIRSYTLTKDDGFTVDVASVRMNAYVDGMNVRDNDDVKVSVGRVTVPITDRMITSGQEITNADGYVRYSLTPGSNTLTFEIDYREKDGDVTLNGESTHVLTIAREGNSVPSFRPNNFEGRLYDLVYNEEIDTSTTRIVLPYATGGNLGRTYSLSGTPPLPDDMNTSFVLPTGQMDGWLGGTPKIRPDGLFADHEITLKVVDGDDITKNDDDTLKFKLRIWNSRDAYNQYGPGAPAARDWGELMALGVYHDFGDTGDSCDDLLGRRSGDTSARDVCAKLVPTFDPSTRTYTVNVPTDVDTVDIHSVASSTATLTLRGEGGSNLGAGSMVFTGEEVGGETGSRHEWNGYELANGSGGSPAPNTYRMSVKDGPNGPDGAGAVTVEYRLTITREADTQVRFSDADKAGQPKVVQVYAGIALDDTDANVNKIKFPLAVLGSGNGASSTWMYSLKHDPSAGGNFSAGNFEGMSFDGLMDGRDPGKNPPTLSGTPVLDAPGGQQSYRSVSRTTYSVKDNDNNEAASDGDKIRYTIIAHADVTLESYTVGDKTVGLADLDKSSRTIPEGWSTGEAGDNYSDWIYSHETIPSYTISVPYNATSTTFAVSARGDGAKAVIKPDDADSDNTNGHQVDLTGGDNVMTVTVSNANGRVMAKHLINLSRPGLQAESIEVETDAGTPVGANNMVQLVRPDGKKGFVSNVYEYTAEVETWIRTVRIAATPMDDAAMPFVNNNATPGATGYSVVLLGDPGTTSTITVGIRIPGQNEDSREYTIAVTRKADTAPSFGDATVDNQTYQSGVIIGALTLPKATGGNGTPLTYSVNVAPLLGLGLNFDPATRQITGTPMLDRGQNMAVIYVTYTAMDADGNKADSDSTMLKFSITVQRGPVTQPAPGDGFGPGESHVTLNTLEIHYRRPGDNNNVYRPADLSPAFAPETTDYSVTVPHDYVFAWVTARPSDTGAGVYIDNVLQSTVSRAPIDGRTAKIVVEHQQHRDLGRMTYNLTLNPTEESVPNFVGEEIVDQVYIAGEAITPLQLPEAMGGNAPIDYMLMYDEMNEVGVTGVGGLHFNASTRMLTGTPTLGRSEAKVEYAFIYVGEDDDGDTTTPPLTFKVTVCESEDLPGCGEPTMPVPNPGATPMDLMVERSGTSATITWRPGDDAASQLVAAVDLSDIVASINATVATVAGDANEYTFTGLSAGVSYTYLVIGLDANGGYMDPSTPSGVSGMVVSE